MFFSNSIIAIDSHTAGEVMRVLMAGYPQLVGDTMQEKMAYMNEKLDWLKTTTMQEPRGHRDMVGAILTPPTKKEADIGVFFFDSINYAPMCGHGIIAISKIMVETGMVIIEEPQTKIVFDTPAGLVKSYVNVKESKVHDVSYESIPAFIYKKNIALTMPRLGEITVDIGYGGNFYALADVESFGFTINTVTANELARMGMDIIKATNETVKVEHPLDKSINYLESMLWCEEPKTPGGPYKILSVYGDAHPDRSPCGTGTATRTARLYSQGKLHIGESFIHESFIGTQFKSKLLREVSIGDIVGVVPEIRGQAYITGFNRLVIDQEDPIKYGIII